MSDEKEYISILDGAEEDAPIVIMPEDGENERDYSSHSGFMSSVAARSLDEENSDEKEKKKRTAADVIRDFWYYHKNAVIIILFLAVLLSVLFSALCSNKPCDLTVALFSENQYSESEMISLKLLLSNNVEDFNKDDSCTVEADFIIGNDEYAAAQAEADYKNGIRCIYLTTAESYEYITGLYPDMFESYNGCAEWIPLSGTDLCRELAANGFDASDLGISLLSRPDGSTEQYDRAVILLDRLREKYPDVFAG